MELDVHWFASDFSIEKVFEASLPHLSPTEFFDRMRESDFSVEHKHSRPPHPSPPLKTHGGHTTQQQQQQQPTHISDAGLIALPLLLLLLLLTAQHLLAPVGRTRSSLQRSY